MKLHLGSGAVLPPGWIHVDVSWNARLAKWQWLRRLLKGILDLPENTVDNLWDGKVRIHDLRKPLPFPDQSVAAIYASHVLDCLYQTEAVRLFKECFRVMRSKGVLRIAVVDISEILKEYAERKAGPFLPEALKNALPADRLAERLGFYEAHPPQGNCLVQFYQKWFDFHSRKWIYDAESLTAYFKQAGFVKVSEKIKGDSRIEGIETVEKRGGLCVEGIRP